MNFNMYDCFISYKVGADNELAHDFSRFLKDDDFSVFIDKKALLPGDNWSNELRNSMKISNYVLAFFTEDYVARIEQGNADGQNFIIEELKWALKDKKLIPISIGLPVNIIEEKCAQWITELRGIQFITFDNKEVVQYQVILNQLNKLIRARTKKNNHTQLSSTSIKATELTSNEAYLKLQMPWKSDEAIKYKETLEGKFLKEPIDYVVLAKFHLTGRFGLKISPELAYQNLEKATRHNCREALFELGLLLEYEDNKYGGDEDKATEYYTQAHKLGDIRATFQLVGLFDENIENTNSPTEFLKNKYNIEHSKQFVSDIIIKKDSYSDLNINEKYCYCLTQIDADENKESAVHEMHALAALGYLPAVRWLGFEYSKVDSNTGQDTQKCLTYLHAGEEQGSVGCRAYLASIYLESAFRKLGFEQNIALGIKKHKENINLNYYESAYDLAWVVNDDQPELQTYISIEERIQILEQAVAFGQSNCIDYLTKAYIETKHSSLSSFVIDTANKGNSSPILAFINSILHTDYSDFISESDYLKIYHLSLEYCKRQPKKQFHAITLILMNCAMQYNRPQDALRAVEMSDEPEKYYFYAKDKRLSFLHNGQKLRFEILKKGAELKENSSHKWLLLIILGLVNPSYKSIFEAKDYDDSFVDDFMENTIAFSIEKVFSFYSPNRLILSEGEFEYINDEGNLTSILLDDFDCSYHLDAVKKARECEQAFFSSNNDKSELLRNYSSLGYYCKKTYTLINKSVHKDTWDLGLSYYKKIFSEAENKNSQAPQSALFIHISWLIKSSNVENNENYIDNLFQKINQNITWDSNDKESSFDDLVSQFYKLYNTFFTANKAKIMKSYNKYAGILFSTLARIMSEIFPYAGSEYFIHENVDDAIEHLTSNDFSDYRKSNPKLSRALFELCCFHIARFPYGGSSLNNNYYAYQLYCSVKTFKFNQSPSFENVPEIIREKLLSAAEDGNKMIMDIIKTSEFKNFPDNQR